MLRIKDLVADVDAFAPFSSCVEGDCVGLLVGDPDVPLVRAAVALDATPATVEAAAARHCQLLLTHHPAYFGHLEEQPEDSAGPLAARLGLAVLCAHTNLDAAPGGVNDCLAARLGLREVEPLGWEADAHPMARVGAWTGESLSTLLASAQERLGVAGVKYTPTDAAIHKVAVCGGSGGDFLIPAKQAGAQALVTGESKHHLRLLARQLDLALIECGHFCTEQPVKAVLADLVRRVGAEAVVLDETDPACYRKRGE